jgi:Tfp pilus assembly PilM family ATPase
VIKVLIKWCLSIGYSTAKREDTIEVDDDLSDEEIEEIVREEIESYIDWGWERSDG